MKKNFILSASLALFAAVPSFAQSNDEAVPQLPAFTVTVDRHTDAEKAIQASLAELRQTAKATPAITAQPALPGREVARTESAKLAPVATTSTTLVAVKA